ncbi:MAG: hypothetical protein QXY50_02760 [Candidatus Caldarchaeum sp.]
MSGNMSNFECDHRCINARGNVCRCRCNGVNHGYMHRQGSGDLVLTHVSAVADVFHGTACPMCLTSLDAAEIYGYPHANGLWIEQFRQRLWVYAVCPKCRYQTSFRKVMPAVNQAE